MRSVLAEPGALELPRGGPHVPPPGANRFFPLGFSPRGHLAWFEEPFDEAVGGYLYRLVVMDLVTDEVVHVTSWRDDELEVVVDRASFLARHGREAAEVLRRFGITGPLPSLSPFPAVTAGDLFTYEVTLSPPVVTPERPADAFANPHRSVLRLRSAVQGVKEVARADTWISRRETWRSGLQPQGYLASPHEPRIAVVSTLFWRGYEGPPHVVGFAVHGAHLATGFVPDPTLPATE